MNFEVLPQILVNGLTSGAIYALLALGLSLIYGVLRFVNFAHGETAMFGGYLFLTFNKILGWPLFPSFLAAVAALVVIGLIIEYTTFLPIKGSPSGLIPLITAIGVGLILKNLVLIIWGSRVHSLIISAKTHSFLNGKIIFTDVHIAIIFFTIFLLAFLTIFLKKTRCGKAIRAVSDNKEISAVLGIDVKKIITIVFVIATALAGIAGILIAFDQNLNHNMGTFLSIKAFAAVILGGIGSIPGSVLGGFIIGLAENLLIGIPFGDFYFPSGLKDALAFIVIILILYFRPSGLFGTKIA